MGCKASQVIESLKTFRLLVVQKKGVKSLDQPGCLGSVIWGENSKLEYRAEF